MGWILNAKSQEEDDEGKPFEVELYLPPDLAELDRCPACHAPMDYSDGMCSECGQIVCPRCGVALGDDEMCPACGLHLVFPCQNLPGMRDTHLGRCDRLSSL